MEATLVELGMRAGVKERGKDRQSAAAGPHG